MKTLKKKKKIPRKKKRSQQAVKQKRSKVGNNRIISSSNVVDLNATEACPEENPTQNTQNNSKKRKSDGKCIYSHNAYVCVNRG